MNKDYQLAPDGAKVLFFTSAPKKSFTLKYAPKPRFKIDVERFKVESYLVKGLKAQGVRLSTRQALSAASEGEQGLFDEAEPVKRAPAPAPKNAAAKKTAKKPSPKPDAKARTTPAPKPSDAKKATSAKPATKVKADDQKKPSGGLLDKASAKKKPPKR